MIVDSNLYLKLVFVEGEDITQGDVQKATETGDAQGIAEDDNKKTDQEFRQFESN